MTENSAIFNARHDAGSFRPHRQPAPTAQDWLKRGNGANWRTTRQLSGECRLKDFNRSMVAMGALNPQQDATGANCMVGQRGFVWFLAGVFPGGNATRTCSVPADKALFFPVANQINFNTPNVCGQGPANLTVADLRASSAAFVAGVTSKSVKVDGRPVMNIQRIQSIVFEVALPEDNVFDALCAPLNVPAGIFSPAVDDGFYVLLRPLQAGSHMIQITAQNKSQGFVLDVKYNLNVVPVSLQ